MSTFERDYLAMIGAVIGSRPDYVQGGGGNMSAKLPDGGLLIKASGVALKDITSDRGLMLLDAAPLREYIAASADGACPTEAESLKMLHARTNDQNARPSMEAWFHLVGKTYVLHTHSVYANIIACAAEADALLLKIFIDYYPRVLFVPYVNPGIALGVALYQRFTEWERMHGVAPDIIFLQNHGLIVTAHHGAACLALHEEVNTLIRNYLSITAPYPPVDDFISAMRAHRPNYFEQFLYTHLFPDQVVYGERVPETMAASLYIRYHIEERGWGLSTIPADLAAALREMESEKYRRALKT